MYTTSTSGSFSCFQHEGEFLYSVLLYFSLSTFFLSYSLHFFPSPDEFSQFDCNLHLSHYFWLTNVDYWSWKLNSQRWLNTAKMVSARNPGESCSGMVAPKTSPLIFKYLAFSSYSNSCRHIPPCDCNLFHLDLFFSKISSFFQFLWFFCKRYRVLYFTCRRPYPLSLCIRWKKKWLAKPFTESLRVT